MPSIARAGENDLPLTGFRPSRDFFQVPNVDPDPRLWLGNCLGISESAVTRYRAFFDKPDQVKQLADLSPREIEHDNPEIRRADEMATFLGRLYNREVSPEDTVTVIRFSEIRR